ncbi:hypothetical protein CWM52_09245 [Raoultella sp. T31]|nr:hypothetical protein CWM52_09245 [Raoultella sp. T31]
MFKTTRLFFATALGEMPGCYLSWLWLKRGGRRLAMMRRRPVNPAGLLRAAFLLTVYALCRLQRSARLTHVDVRV